MKRRIYQLAVIVVSLFVIQGLSRNLIELNSQRKRMDQAKKELEELQKEERELQKQLEYYLSDEYMEKIAREKLMLGKEGETVLIIPKENKKTLNPALRSLSEGGSQLNDNLPNWRKWAYLFDIKLPN